MTLQDKLLKQFRNPSGGFGRVNLWDMNRRHGPVTDWGLGHVTFAADATILDVGCGGGKTMQNLAGMARQGRVYGVDHSSASIDASRYLNRRLIDAGRVELRQAGVSRLPFRDQMFDLVTAVETHFYWPDLRSDMREVWRVLKPGGTLLIIAEIYKGGKFDRRAQTFAAAMTPLGYSHLSVDEHRDMFATAGFSDVEVFEEYEKGWICAKGRRPA
jgi:SAM-dependent methyltransferase